MDAYSGFEPQVGEIAGVRSFRLGRDGVLLPLFGSQPWTDGANTAQCRAGWTGEAALTDHDVVDPNCSCGFYAFADDTVASDYPHSRHVLAVVSCWGRVVAGTRGLRCECARVTALWMSAAVPADLVALIAARYPATAIYSDRELMLAEHPPTPLDCYEPDRRMSSALRFGVRAGFAGALGLGVLPRHVLAGSTAWLAAWAAMVVLQLVVAVGCGRSSGGQQRRMGLFAVAAVLWLLAPLAGAAGVLLLRLPVLQVAVLGIRQRAAARREARRFPVDVR